MGDFTLVERFGPRRTRRSPREQAPTALRMPTRSIGTAVLALHLAYQVRRFATMKAKVAAVFPSVPAIGSGCRPERPFSRPSRRPPSAVADADAFVEAGEGEDVGGFEFVAELFFGDGAQEGDVVVSIGTSGVVSAVAAVGPV